MNGTVTRMRAMGVEATMDAPTDQMAPGSLFQIYRLNGDAEEIVGTAFPKRSKGDNLICLNPVEGSAWNNPQLGDLVRSI